jgi:predicted dehydrogenase
MVRDLARDMVRYGILGFGHHGERRLAPAFAGAQRSQLAGIWRRDTRKAHAAAERHGIEHVFATPKELCSSPAIDAVFVATPDALHCEHTLLALRSGKAVLCEKPMAMNAAEAEGMVTTARSVGRPLGVAQNFRYNRSLERMRALLAEGCIGAPIFASAYFCFLSQQSPRSWIDDSSLACGGPIGDVGIHAIDALRFLLQQDVLAVSTLALPHQRHRDPTGPQLEATAALTLEMSGGTLASVQVSFRALYRTFIDVTGASGVLSAESGLTVDRPVTLLHQAGGALVATEELANADGYTRMLDAFSAAVLDQGSFAATGEDGLLNQRVLDAAFRSWHNGCHVRVG